MSSSAQHTSGKKLERSYLKTLLASSFVESGCKISQPSSNSKMKDNNPSIQFTVKTLAEVSMTFNMIDQGPVHTYPDLFENASFLSVLGSRPHGDGVFSHRKRSFSKTLSRVDRFENAVFLFSCRRVKTELFENADVTASIYDVSEHALGSLGITRGHFACLFSFIEVRMPNIVIDYGISLSNIEL